MWLAAETTDNEEFKGREEAVEQEGEAERELVEERGRTTEQEGKAGSNTATGREGRAAAEEGAKAAERTGATGREGATERGALDLLRHVYLESLLQDALEAKITNMAHSASAASHHQRQCGDWRVKTHSSALLRRSGKTVCTFLGTSARAESNLVGESEPRRSTEMPQ